MLRVVKGNANELIAADRLLVGRRRTKRTEPMNTKAPAVDITQGYASRAFLGRDEYQAIVGTPQFRTARAAQARKLPEAQGKEDYAEFLAISIVDYPMAQISEKLKSYAAGDYSPSFSKFLASKYGLSPTAWKSVV